MGKTLWKSPNKKWEIVDDTDNLRFKTDWNDNFSTVARVSASDGWGVAYASIDVNGRLWTGDFNTNWEYFVPKTVQAKAFSILRAMYKAKKQKETGKAQLPLQYVVIVTGIGRTDKLSYYRTYDTAVKHAEMEWKKLNSQQRSKGAFVNLGRLSDRYMSAKDVPARFSYNLLGSITKEYNSFEKKRRA